jgi:hypothetical protein
MNLGKLGFALVGLTSSVALSSCSWNQSSAVEKAQQNLIDVRAESAQNIQRAESELAEVIAKTNSKLEAARRDLKPAPRMEEPPSTMSGTTQPAGEAPTPAPY